MEPPSVNHRSVNQRSLSHQGYPNNQRYYYQPQESFSSTSTITQNHNIYQFREEKKEKFSIKKLFFSKKKDKTTTEPAQDIFQVIPSSGRNYLPIQRENHQTSNSAISKKTLPTALEAACLISERGEFCYDLNKKSDFNSKNMPQGPPVDWKYLWFFSDTISSTDNTTRYAESDGETEYVPRRMNDVSGKTSDGLKKSTTMASCTTTQAVYNENIHERKDRIKTLNQQLRKEKRLELSICQNDKNGFRSKADAFTNQDIGLDHDSIRRSKKKYNKMKKTSKSEFCESEDELNARSPQIVVRKARKKKIKRVGSMQVLGMV